jgi:23S rRNA pseudouridine1911/1915/1917 synthase
MQYKSPRTMKLLDALAEMFPDSSKSNLRAWLKKERVLLKGVIEQHPNALVKAGDQVATRPSTRKIPGDIEILYEDRHLVIVDKPHGLLSVSTNFEKEDTLFYLLKREYKPRSVYVVHRLDRETSGVLVFALSVEAMEGLKKMFAKHDLERDYCALVEGSLASDSGKWESYLVEDANYHVRSVSDPKKGRHSVTNYRVMQRTKNFTLLTLRLETGRKNQIRVHCQDAGHPIVGDMKYGSSKNPVRRLCLHAYKLGFNHPVTGKSLFFESLIPKVFSQTICP